MFDRLTRRLYERMGCRYWLVMVVGQGWASVGVAVVTIAVFARYYGPPLRDVVVVSALGAGLTVIAVLYAAVRMRPVFNRLVSWGDATDPSQAETVAAWQAATTFTLTQYRRDSATVNLLVVIPTCLAAAATWDIGVTGFLTVLVACVVPAAYATVLSYSIGEVLARPLVQHIADALPTDFRFERHGLPVAKRLKVGLPAYTSFAGIIVTGVLGDGGGSERLLLAVVVSAAVGVVLSQELAFLLANAITRPITELGQQLARVRGGDYTARVALTSNDELGQLGHDFNLAAQGLAEREEMRKAFDTYMDREVVQLILSGQFPRDGVEVDVSIMFCDVRGFTSYAEQASAQEVIASLNRLFEDIVPIIDRHGGHVDKFTGDGLLAVFGAPEAYPDHADRAVSAACEIVTAVAEGATDLTMAAGVNWGTVVAGPVGGAGRLNFSVIGDVVNVAARVEGATRQTGDDVLITAATSSRLLRPLRVESRGSITLKGKSDVVEVLAPVVSSRARELT